MSNKVDERITRIRFDNDQFERGVATSMQSLDRLKNKLESTESVEAFTGIQRAANKTDFSQLGSAVEGVSKKFQILEQAAIKALANIMVKAAEAGASLIKNLSTENMMVGWNKYNQEVEAVQTIMVTLDDTPIEEIEDHLAKISWFADETSYSYNDMVGSMSKLISSGVNLDDATNAVIGLSNAAAAAGISTKKATSAFYNFSQAFGAGYMQLQDWRSIELLNMATPEFKRNIIQTAVSLGKLVQVGDDLYATSENLNKPDSWFSTNSMRNSLKDKWFDNEVMNQVLKTYSTFADQVYEAQNAWDINTASETMKQLEDMGLAVQDVSNKAFRAAQEAKTFAEAVDSVKDAISSQWKDTFKSLFGNYEEAKGLWTDLAEELYDLFATSGEVRNGILDQWNDPLSFMVPDEKVREAYKFPELQSGREILIEGLWNIFHSITNVVSAIKEAWREIFPQFTAKKLYDMTKSFRSFTERMLKATENLEGFKKFLVGVFSILRGGLNGVKEVFKFVKKWDLDLSNVKVSMLSLAENAKSLFSTIFSNIRNSERFGNVLSRLGSVFNTVKDAILNFNLSAVKLPTFEGLISSIKNLKFNIGDIRDYITRAIRWIGRLFKKDSAEEEIQYLTETTTTFVSATRSFSNEAVPIFSNIKKNFETMWNTISGVIIKIKPIVSGILSWIEDRLKKFDLKDILGASVIGVFSWFTIKLGKAVPIIANTFDTIGKAVGDGVSSLLKGVASIFTGFNQLEQAYAKQIKAQTITTYLKSIAFSLLAIVGALYLFSKIPDENGNLEKTIKYVGTIGAVLAFLCIVLATVDAIINRTSKAQAFTGVSVKGIQVGGTGKRSGVLGLMAGLLGMVLAVRWIANIATKDGMTEAKLKQVASIVREFAFTMTSCIIAIHAVNGIINKFAPGSARLSSLSPLFLATSMLMMIRVLKQLDNMELKDSKKVLLSLLEILGIMGLFAFAFRSVSAGTGIGMLGTVASILLFMYALKKVQDMELKLEGNEGLIGLFFGLLIVIGLISMFSKNSIVIDKQKQSIHRVGTNMLSIILGLAACIGAIYLLTKIPKEDLWRGVGATLAIIGVLFGGLIALMAVLSHQGKYAGRGLIGASILLAFVTVMVIIFTLLARFDKNSLEVAINTILVMGVAMALMLAPLALINSKPKGLLNLVWIFLALAAAVTAFYLFAKNDSAKLNQAVLSVMGITVALGVSCWLISHISSASVIADGHHMLELILGLLALTTVAAIALSYFVDDGDKAIKGAAAVSLMAVAVSVACIALGSFPPINFTAVALTLLQFLGIVAILTAAVWAMSKFINGENLGWLKTYGGELLAMLAAFTLIAAFFTLIGAIVPLQAIGVGLAAFLGTAAALILIMLALGGIAEAVKYFFEKNGKNAKEEIRELVDIVYEFGSLIGAFIDGLVFGALPNVGQSLSDFADNIQPFIDFVALIPEDFGEKLSIFAQGFADITTAGFWYNLKDFFSGKGDLLTDTLTTIEEAADPLGKMVTALAGITDVEKAEAVLDAMTKIGPALTSINNAEVGNLADVVFPALSTIAGNLQTFGNSLTIIDDTAVNKIGWVTRALSGIGDAASKFFDQTGGIIMLEEVGIQIQKLGEGIKEYLTSVAGITEDDVKKTDLVSQCLTKLLNLNSKIGKNKGLGAWFTGWTDLGKFGDQLAKFVSGGLTNYLNKAGKLTYGLLADVKHKTPVITTIIGDIAGLNEAIGKNKGAWQGLTGTTDYGKFGKQLAGLADGILAYAEKLIFTTSDLDRTVKITDSISAAIMGLATAEKVSVMNLFINTLKELATNAVENFKTMFTSDETKTGISDSIKTMLGYVKTAADAIAYKEEYLKTIFATLFDSIGRVISNGFANIKIDASELVDNIVSGMTTSFNNGEKTLVTTWEKIQEKVAKTGEKVWQVKSPSRLTAKLGRNIVQGEINGIASMSSNLNKAFDDVSGTDYLTKKSEETGSVIGDLINSAKETFSDFGKTITEENGSIIENIGNFFTNLKSGVSDYSDQGMAWLKSKFDEFIGETGLQIQDGTNWQNLIFGNDTNPFGDDEYYAQLQSDFQNWLGQDYELGITPVLTDENGNEIANWSDLLGSGGSYSGTVAGYTSEDIRNLTAEIYHLEDALFSLKEAMKNQQITHSGELTIRYSNESDFIDRIQTAIIGDLRRST